MRKARSRAARIPRIPSKRSIHSGNGKLGMLNPSIYPMLLSMLGNCVMAAMTSTAQAIPAISLLDIGCT